MFELRMAARAGTFLYDCHARAFATLDHGHSIVTGFVPLYLSRLFGVRMAEWPAFLARARTELAALSDEEADRYVRERRPRVEPARALDMALLVYPSATRYIELRDDHHAPFALRDESLWQPNVELACLEGRDAGGAWQPLVDGADALRAVLPALAAFANGRAVDGGDGLGRFLAARASRDRPHLAGPGVYLLGHSALLVRGRDGGVLIDPIHTSSIARATRAWSLPRLRPLVDGVLLTHAHFDHYHVPTLLALGDLPLVVPVVPRASVVCEDVAARLRGLGAAAVTPLAWGAATEIADVRVRALPFLGEQFLTSEEHPGARNWGNCYALEAAGARILVVADAGFERDRSILDVVRDEVARAGAFDVVLAQAIGLPTAFGLGDADLQIAALACAHRAGDAVELLRPKRRVTLAVEDLPSLCETARARTLVLYGQFQFERGGRSVLAALVDRACAALARAGVATAVVAPAVGEGVGLDGALTALAE